MEDKTSGVRPECLIGRILACAWLLFAGALHCGVVINEVCYDPVGADSGKEWIELYNPTSDVIDLSGCKIYSCGTTWVKAFEFPYYLLRPGRFVVVGGAGVPNTQFTASFSFQNGGSASDAIRFVNADSTYTDTVIYDEPNSNLIPDDWGTVASSLAPDAPEGSSLARVADGWDTNMCAVDFRIENNPTPNAPNRVYTDYALYDPILYDLGPGKVLTIGIRNLGNYQPPYIAIFSVYARDELIHQEEIQPLGAADSIRVDFVLPSAVELLYLHLDLTNDTDPENNLLHFSTLGSNVGTPLFSEIFPAPLPGKQEWIEIYAPPEGKRGQLTIIDAGGGIIRFSLPPVPGYFVICRDRSAFLADYPAVNPALVLQSDNWTALNNDGDALLLWDEDLLLDSVSYTSSVSAMSYLRYQVDFQDHWKWGEPSPGKVNDAHLQELPEHPERLKLLGSPCDVAKGEQVSISYNLPDASSRINCRIYDLQGRLVVSLAEHSLVSERGLLAWNGRLSGGRYAPRGVYLILWESQPASGGRIYRRQLSAVIK